MNEFEPKNVNEGIETESENLSQIPEMPQVPQMPTEAPVEKNENEQTDEQELDEKVQESEESSSQEQTPATEQTPVTEEKPKAYTNFSQGYQSRPNTQQPYQGYAPYQHAGYPQQQNGYQGGYNPQQYPNPYAGQPYTQNQQQVPQGYYNNIYPQNPEKQKMSGGLKALIIIIIAILTASVIGFTAYLAFNYESQKQEASNNSNNSGSIFGGDIFGDFGDFGDEYGFNTPTSPSFTPEQSSDKNYEQSDASDKVNPDYKGIELKGKPHEKTSSKYNASYTYKAVQNAVVGVACYYEEDKGTSNYQSQGTGIIVTSDGYIVTNSHVIGNSRKAYLIKVITADKKEYEAGVVGYDSRSDLAVLKIDAQNLPVAQFGNSAYTEITEEVVAIGNPSGIEFQNSVTKGIVSALDRKVSTSNNVEFIQIDAAINPGNSGGPLCNMYGQVIGINTVKIASESYEGMGFAIPSATVKKIVDDIIKYSYVTNRVKVGITGQAVYESQAGADGIKIIEITKDGPMDGTGAEVGDIITAVDGEKTTTFAEIFDILEKHKEGDKVKVSLYRPSENKTVDIEITLQMDKAEE